MAYAPVVNAATIELWIGTPAVGVVTASSTSVTGVTFFRLPGQSAACTLTAADVGCPIAIIGGGPVNALMPASYFIQGGLFHTTIASVTSSTSCTLAAAPNTSITSAAFPIIVVYRKCPMQSDVATGASGFTFSSSIAPGTQDSFTFTAQPFDNPYITRFQMISQGQPVYLLSTDTGEIFGGQIYSLTAANMVGYPNGVFSWTATCSGWRVIAQRRIVPPTNPQTFTGTCDQVFSQIVLTYLNNEGITPVATSGPTITISCNVGIYIDKLLDQVVTALSTPTQQWIWYADAWRNYVLEPFTTTAAPWNISDGGDMLAGDTPYQMTLTTTEAQLANSVYASGSNVSIPDGIAMTFWGTGEPGFPPLNVGVPITTAPTITLNGVTQTVAVYGGGVADYYYVVGSPWLIQSSPTPLTSSQFLTVTLAQPGTAAVTPEAAQYFNTSSIAQQSDDEATSGMYDYWINVQYPVTQPQLQSLAQTYSNQYGIPAQIFSAYTLRPGLDTGQTIAINLPQLGVSGTFLIETISLTTVSNVLQWQFTAFQGASVGDAITGLVQFINRQNAIGTGSTSALATGGPPPPPPGAIVPSYRQGRTATASNAAPSVAFSASCLQHSLLVCSVFQIGGGSPLVTSVTDSVGNTWVSSATAVTCAPGPTSGGQVSVSQFVCLGNSTAGPITVTPVGSSGSVGFAVTIDEYTGGTTWTADISASDASSGGASTGSTMTNSGSPPSTAHDNEIAIASTAALSPTFSAPYTYDGAQASPFIDRQPEHYIVNSGPPIVFVTIVGGVADASYPTSSTPAAFTVSFTGSPSGAVEIWAYVLTSFWTA